MMTLFGSTFAPDRKPRRHRSDVWRNASGHQPSLRGSFPVGMASAIRIVLGLTLSVAIGERALGDEPVRPAFVTTYQLMAMCIVDDTKKRAECIAYLAGVVDALRAADSADDHARFCLPTGMTEDDVRKVMTQFLKADPQWYDKPPVTPISMAVQKAFPCPGATP